MAPPADLREASLDGFALIEKFFGPGRGTKSNNGKRDEFSVVFNSKQAAAYYGGLNIISYPMPKPHNRWGRPLKP